MAELPSSGDESTAGEWRPLFQILAMLAIPMSFMFVQILTVSKLGEWMDESRLCSYYGAERVESESLRIVDTNKAEEYHEISNGDRLPFAMFRLGWETSNVLSLVIAACATHFLVILMNRFGDGIVRESWQLLMESARS